MRRPWDATWSKELSVKTLGDAMALALDPQSPQAGIVTMGHGFSLTYDRDSERSTAQVWWADGDVIVLVDECLMI